MTALPEQQALDPRRECNICPPWVERCAHFGDEWVAFHVTGRARNYWATCQGKGIPHEVDSVEFNHDADSSVCLEVTTDHDAALAAFYEAKAALLEREL